MCGILGFTDNDEALAKRMSDAIAHRGPDDIGIYADTRFTFVNRRLAVIDVSPKGHQPMWAPDNSLGIAYNGEIYNYRELRKDLESRGEIFESESDTEVILRGFALQGESYFSKLRGMWAIAIYAPEKGELILSRDPYGIKPLYYLQTEEQFAFASEIKALNVFAKEKRIQFHLSKIGTASFFSLGYSIHPYTVFEEVRKLEPGTTLTVRLSDGSLRSRKIEPRPADLKETLGETLLDSVTHHLVADVPVGVYLSGGVDSTLIALLLNDLKAPLHSFTVSMPGRSDAAFAKKVAEHSGLTHHEVPLSRENIQDAYEEFFKVVDDPVADSAIIPTLVISREARKHVTCVLTGEGGDELFFGYDRYKNMRGLSKIRKYSGFFERMLSRTNFGFLRSLYRRLRIFEAYIRNDALEAYLDLAGIGVSDRAYRIVSKEIRARLNGTRAMSAIDEKYYLPDALLYKNDLGTMAHSVEGRTPYLDPWVGAFAKTIPLRRMFRGNVGKRPLRTLLEKRLPKGLIMKGKSGFSVPRELLRPHIERDLPDALQVLKELNVDAYSPEFFRRLTDPAFAREAFKSVPTLMFAIVVFAKTVSKYDVLPLSV